MERTAFLDVVDMIKVKIILKPRYGLKIFTLSLANLYWIILIRGPMKFEVCAKGR